MTLRKIILSTSVAMIAFTASAQSTDIQNPVVGAGKYNRTLSINNFRNLPDAQLKVLGKHISANGYPTRATAKQLLKANSAIVSLAKKKAGVSGKAMKAKYVASDTLFWESFEDWDGETTPYIPTNLNKWATKTNIDNLTPFIANGLCPTWTVRRGDGYYVPYAKDRDLMLVCSFADDIYAADGSTIVQSAPQQDEWLVSPTINSIDKTNYLSFDICYAPWNTHYFIEGKDSIFDVKRVAYDMEVLVTTTTRSASFNAADYTQVYKLSEEVDKEIANVDLNNDEEFGKLYYMNWHHIQIPLADYEGKNIRVAFRYTGTKGGSVLIDAVRVSDLLPVANYDIPKGAFYWGFSNEMYSMTTDKNPQKVALLPAFMPTVWNNLSNPDAKDFTWTYSIDGTNNVQSPDYNLCMPACAPSPLMEMPKLVANAGVRTDEIMAGSFKVGGNTQVTFPNGQVVNYNVGNYDISKSWWTAEIGLPGSQCYTFGTGSGSFWAATSNYRYNNVDGIANYYEKPLAPYVMNEVTLPLGDYLNFGATLACTIYKVDKAGFVSDEILAQSVYNPNAANPKGSCTLVPNTAGMYLLKFVFDEALVIDEPIFISIDGFNNSSMMSIAPIAQALNHDNGVGYAFVKLNTQSNGYTYVEVAGALAAVDGGSNMHVSHCIGMNAVFPFLRSSDGDVFAASSEGETKAFGIDTYWEPKDWNLAISDSWVKAEKIIDEATFTASLKITADALPAGMEGRVATVKISALGCEETITVLQGSAVTGIDAIGSNADFTDGTFTLAGQRINAADARGGVFIVKKGGKVLKVRK